MTVGGLDGFLTARWKHRLQAAVLLRRGDGAVLLVRHGGAGWQLPGGTVRPDSTPRATAVQSLARLALERSVGRLLVQDFRSAGDGGSQVQVYDAGAWATQVPAFTAAAGELEARFCRPAEFGALLGAVDRERVEAGLWALELGVVAELEDGCDVSPRTAPGSGAPPPRPLMPPLPRGLIT